MQVVRLRYKEVFSIMVAYDCVKDYAVRSNDSENLKAITCNYLIDELRKNNKDYETAALKAQYDPVKHLFTVYEVLPYVCDTTDVPLELDD